MSVIGDLRAGLKANLDPIDGIQVSRYFLPNPTPPVVHLWLSGPLERHGAFALGKVTYLFTVQAVVDWTDDAGSQAMLDKYLDPTGSTSVAEAIESDPTLGGVADSVMVTEISGHQPAITADNRATLTVDWTVEIFVNSSS